MSIPSWMITALMVVGAVLLCRGLGLVLRRSKAGSAIIAVCGKLVWLGVLGIVGALIDIQILSWFRVFWILIFLQTPISLLFQSLHQIIGNAFAYIAYKLKPPSKESYALKGSYILPFTGKWTVVNGGSSKELSHSWGIVSQRYAYDFVIVDDEGKTRSGDARSVGSYYCYGKDIIAPADGVVVSLRKKYKDSFVDGKNAYCDAPNLTGNFIVIKHNDDEYSFIAHIMKDSITVKVGDEVKQGDVIAKCGNTGNSSEPHIHFQLQSGKSFFFSAGLPIAFSGISAQEKAGYDLLDKRPCGGNLQVEGGISYIGRGLEVENAPGSSATVAA